VTARVKGSGCLLVVPASVLTMLGILQATHFGGKTTSIVKPDCIAVRNRDISEKSRINTKFAAGGVLYLKTNAEKHKRWLCGLGNYTTGICLDGRSRRGSQLLAVANCGHSRIVVAMVT